MWLVYGPVAVVTVISMVDIVNPITSNLIRRTREFGMLSAVGITGRQLRRMTRLEGLFSWLLSAAWSLPAAVVCVAVGVGATHRPVRRLSCIEVVEALRSVV